MMGDILDLPFKILKWAVIVVAICVALVLLGYAVGHCFPQSDGVVPVAQMRSITTPNTTVEEPIYKYELDEEHLKRCQKLLSDFAKIDLQAIEGTAFALKSSLQTKTFVIVLKCIDHECMISAVAIFYRNDRLEKIEIKPTGERLSSS